MNRRGNNTPTTNETGKNKPFLYSIEEAVYRLKVGRNSSCGEVLISGRIISGDRSPIPLFDKDIAITEVKQVTGGSVLSGQDDDAGLIFLPSQEAQEFQLMLSFLVRHKKDDRSSLVSFAIPSVLRNSLHVTLPPVSRLIVEPGIADSEGIYRFSAAASLQVRFTEYKTRGIRSWRYKMDPNVGRVQNLNLVVKTGFENIDYTDGSLSPMSTVKDGKGMLLPGRRHRAHRRHWVCGHARRSDEGHGEGGLE